MVRLLIISRKKRYLIQTILFLVLGYFLFIQFNYNIGIELLINILFVILFLLFAHYPNVKLNNVVYGSILPLQLVTSATLFFYFYPNLSYIFKVGALLIFSLMYYIVAFVDNVFFVVQDREEQIPLYRVASTWGQILSVVIAIPLYAAISKFNLLFFVQAGLIFISSLLFSFYQFWILSFDKDLKKARGGEFILLNLLVGFLVLVASISVSFLPVESFLRALFTASVLMFGLNYTQSHLKNDITDKFLYQSLFISFIFFIILILFR